MKMKVVRIIRIIKRKVYTELINRSLAMRLPHLSRDATHGIEQTHLIGWRASIS